MATRFWKERVQCVQRQYGVPVSTCCWHEYVFEWTGGQVGRSGLWLMLAPSSFSLELPANQRDWCRAGDIWQDLNAPSSSQQG